MFKSISRWVESKSQPKPILYEQSIEVEVTFVIKGEKNKRRNRYTVRCKDFILAIDTFLFTRKELEYNVSEKMKLLSKGIVVKIDTSVGMSQVWIPTHDIVSIKSLPETYKKVQIDGQRR